METAPSDSELETWSKLHDVINMLSLKLGPHLVIEGGGDCSGGDQKESSGEEDEEASGEEDEEASGEEDEEASGEEEEEASGEEEEEASGKEEEEASGEEEEKSSCEEKGFQRTRSQRKKGSKSRERNRKKRGKDNFSDNESPSPRNGQKKEFDNKLERDDSGVKMGPHVKPIQVLKWYDLGPNRGVKKKI